MSRGHYFNEFDPGAAAWLRELIRQGHLPGGDVDERDIREVRPDDLRGYVSCHFFAGIGVWAYALRRAGWPDERPVWTGSCPCQPFSAAGKGGGFKDDRHLWPELFRLVRECRPVVCFGEQVDGNDGFTWLDLVCSDLEGCGYAVGATVTPAAGYGAPHARHRLYWVADAAFHGRHEQRRATGSEDGARGPGLHQQPADRGRTSPLADAGGERWEWRAGVCGGRRGAAERGEAGGDTRDDGESRGVADTQGAGGRADFGTVRGGAPAGLREAEGEDRRRAGVGPRRVGDCGTTGLVGDAAGDGRDERQHAGDVVRPAGGEPEHEPRVGADVAVCPGPTGGFWADAEWIHCRPEPKYPAGRWRAVEPGTFPLAHGSPARVGRLRGYGNGLVAPQAEAFVRAYLEVEAEG